MIRKKKIIQPVTYEEACSHLRLDFGDDEGLVNRLIKTATQLAENYIEKSIAKTENTLTISNFYGTTVLVDEGNFLSISSITADDETISDSYTTTVYDEYFIITFNNSIVANDLVIKFYSGYDEDECPEDIKIAILVKLGELFDIDRSGYVMNSHKATGAFESVLNYRKPIKFK